jgi:hypothetical protein
MGRNRTSLVAGSRRGRAAGGDAMKPRPDTTPAPRSLGSIRGDEVQPAELFRENMGISVKAWREWLHRGLRTVQAGKRQYVLGSDALAFFRKLAEEG